MNRDVRPRTLALAGGRTPRTLDARLATLTVRMGAHTDQTTRMIATELRERGLVAPGADVVVVGASRADGGRRTNLIRLVHIRGG